MFDLTLSRRCLVLLLRLFQAVRFGRLDVFNTVVEKFEDVFRRDSNYNLIQRLRQTVLKIGARVR